MEEQSEYDFVVVGAGTMGRSTALYLSLKYPLAQCALIEQYSLDHEEGSSHSKTRIIRSTYSNKFYHDLCMEAITQNWKQLEMLFKCYLLHLDPYLKYVDDDKSHREHAEVANASNHIKQVSSEQVNKMFPLAPDIKTDKTVFLEEDAGIIHADRYLQCIIEHLRKQNNMKIMENTSVNSICNQPGGVILELKTKKETRMISASKVALTCGRWMAKLVPALKTILKPVRQIVSYWEMKDHEKYKVGRYPAWSHKKQNLGIFCLPDSTGEGLKYAIHDENPLEGQDITERGYIKHKMEELMENMDEHFKGRYVKLKKIENCYYTFTKTEDFLIDWTDEHENILVVSTCSGHGFKFSPIIGEIVADLLKENKSFELFEDNRYLMRMQYHKGLNLE